MADIKRVIQKIYNFDFSKCEVSDGDEFIITDHGNEFVNTFIKRDLDKGIIVTPTGYSQGLIYKSTNGGEFYNKSDWYPEIVDFSFNLFGLKKNAFYRINVIARNSSKYNSISDVTDNRDLYVSNDNQELVLKEDLSSVMTNKECVGIFRATATEMNLHFSIGKIYINNIIIEEVELAKEQEEVVEKANDFEFDSGKSSIVAYGVFSNEVEYHGKYGEIEKITGKGLNLYYDKTENVYLLERDNYEDTIGTSFTNANYIVEFCFNKAPYASYQITDVSFDVSPNTLKQGYIKFQIFDNGTAKRYDRINGRLSFIVKKIL